jgi:hypothetical protein
MRTYTREKWITRTLLHKLLGAYYHKNEWQHKHEHYNSMVYSRFLWMQSLTTMYRVQWKFTLNRKAKLLFILVNIIFLFQLKVHLYEWKRPDAVELNYSNWVLIHRSWREKKIRAHVFYRHAWEVRRLCQIFW